MTSSASTGGVPSLHHFSTVIERIPIGSWKRMWSLDPEAR